MSDVSVYEIALSVRREVAGDEATWQLMLGRTVVREHVSDLELQPADAVNNLLRSE